MGWAMAINKEVFCSTFVLFSTFKLKPSLETHSAALEQVVRVSLDIVTMD